MSLNEIALKLHSQVNTQSIKFGDIKNIAKEIKKDHALALELWSTKSYFSRLLTTLILDKKLINQDLIDKFDNDMQIHSNDEKNHLMEWLMANQLSKDKSTIALILSWKKSKSSLQRRTFWYYQARLRWTGKIPPENTEELLSEIEKNIQHELPEVQWAMNFTAAWIGVFDEKNRNRCIKIGEKTGLYKDEVVSKGCTPSYLPLFIDIEVNKRKK